MVREQLELAGALLALLLGSSSDTLVQSDGNGNGAVDDISNADEVVLSEATAGHCRGTHAKTAGNEGRTVTRDGVLVGSNADELEDALDTAAVHTMRLQVSKNQMVVGTAANKAISKTSLALIVAKTLGKSLGVGKNLGLIGVEVRGLSLLQGNRESRDSVVVRATLVTWEDGGVDGAFKVVHLIDLCLGVLASNPLAEEDQGTTRTTKTLVAGGGNDVGILEGARKNLGSDQAGDMGHISEHVGVDLVANLTDALVVNQATVGAGAGNDDLGAVEERKLLKLLVVDESGLLIQAVRDSLKVLGDGGNLLGGRLVAVRKMATVWQVETHQSVVRLHEGRVDVKVGRGARKSYDRSVKGC